MLKKFKSWRKRNKTFIIVCLFIVAFPISTGILYKKIDMNKYFAVELSNLLQYFATAFGIVGSFVTYKHEKNKHEKEKSKELKPEIFIKLETSQSNAQIFKISVYNHTEYKIKNFFIFDEYFKKPLDTFQQFNFCFNKENEDYAKLKENCHDLINITEDDDIMDVDNLPKYILISCDDKEKNMWNCIFEKKDLNEKYYIPYFELT